MIDADTSLFLADENATWQLGARLAARTCVGDVFTLHGGLGAGKTTLARGFIQSLLGNQTDVPSPTFTLVQTYEASGFDIWHTDLYRLENPHDIIELGLEDAFDEAVTLIEWPEKLGPYLPRRRLEVHLQADHKTGRTARLIPFGNGWESVFEDQ